MAHISPDFKTKKAFKEAVARGMQVCTFSPGPFPVKEDGEDFVEAPADYHRWYARVEVRKGCVVKVLD